MTKNESNFAAVESLALDMLENFDGGYNIPAHEALIAFDRVALHLGLDSNDIALVHALVAASDFQDWSFGNKPMVWLSDEQLQDISKLSAQALQHHTLNLVRNGLIGLDGDANMESFSRRSADNSALDMRRFDLSPLAARTPEFEWIAEALQYERQIAKRECDDAADVVGSVLATLSSLACSAQIFALTSIKERFQKLLASLPFQAGKEIPASEKGKSFLGGCAEVGSSEQRLNSDRADYIVDGSPGNAKQPDHGAGYIQAADEIISDGVHVVGQAGSFYGRYDNASLEQPEVGFVQKPYLSKHSWFAESDTQTPTIAAFSNSRSLLAAFAEMPLDMLRRRQGVEYNERHLNRKAAGLRVH